MTISSLLKQRLRMIKTPTKGMLLFGTACLWIGLNVLTSFSEEQATKVPGNLTLEEAIQSALENNPVIRSATSQIRAREAERNQARILRNPEIEAEAENIAGTGELSGTDAAEYTLFISQPILLGGKRSGQIRVAEAEYQIAKWMYESTKRDLIKDVTSTFAEVLENQEHVKLSKDLVKLSEELVQTALRRVKSGGASVLEQIKAEIERATSLAEQEQMHQRRIASRRALALLIGKNPSDIESVSGNLYQLHDLTSFETLKQQLPNNPDWTKWSAEIQKQEAAVALANAERFPDLNLGAGIRRDEDANATALVFAAGLPLPIFNRNQGARIAAKHELSATVDEQQAHHLALRRALAGAYSELTRAHAQATAIIYKILPAATKAFEVSHQGYLQGRFGYLDLLDAQRTLFKTRGQYVETLRMYHQAVAEVERLIARPLEIRKPIVNK